MLKIRPYIENQDELIYLNIINRAMAEFSDFTPLTLVYAHMENDEPNTDKTGRFIAEWNGKPVGYVYALIDLLKDDNIQYLDGPFVLPEFRQRHIGSELIKTAVESFKDRGVKKIQAGARSDNMPAQKFLEKHEFTICREFSQMQRGLDNLPQNVGENTKVKIADIGTSDQALELENELMNQTFKEHFNFRPLTIEERIFYTRAQEKQGIKFNSFVASINDCPVGMMITAIDPQEIEHKKEQVAWLAVLGVLKPYRHQGIGKALMIHAMHHLKSQDMEKVLLGVDDTNITQAIKIYVNLGFAVSFKRHLYIKAL